MDEALILFALYIYLVLSSFICFLNMTTQVWEGSVSKNNENYLYQLIYKGNGKSMFYRQLPLRILWLRASFAVS